MITTVEGNGSILVRGFDGRAERWDVNPLPVTATAPNLPTGAKFTAVSGNSHKRFYGVVDGTIHEWEFRIGSSGGLVTWSYLGPVPTSL